MGFSAFKFSNGNLPANLNDLIVWQVEEVTHVRRISFRQGRETFLPAGEAQIMFAMDCRCVADIIGNIPKVDHTSESLAVRKYVRNVWALHEAIRSLGGAAGRNVVGKAIGPRSQQLAHRISI